MHTRLIATTDPHRVKPVTVNMKKTLRQLLMWNTYNVTYSKVIKPCYCKSYIANINEKQSPQIVVNKSKCWCPENLVLRLMCVEQRTGPCTVFYCEHVWFSGYLALYYGVFIHVFTNSDIICWNTGMIYSCYTIVRNMSYLHLELARVRTGR